MMRGKNIIVLVILVIAVPWVRSQTSDQVFSEPLAEITLTKGIQINGTNTDISRKPGYKIAVCD